LDSLRVVAEDDDDLIELRAGRCVDRVLDERLCLELEQLLRGTEPRRRSRREDDGGDHRSRALMPNSFRNHRTMPENIAESASRSPPTGAAAFGGAFTSSGEASVASGAAGDAASAAMFVRRQFANCCVSFAET